MSEGEGEDDRVVSDDHYEVGYGKPPKHTRFQKGQSGNARGREKGSLNIKTSLQRTLEEPVTYLENGRKVKRSRLELANIQLVNAAAKGNLRAIELVHKFGQLYGIGVSKETASTQNDGSVGSPEDHETLDALLKRFREETEQ